MSLMDEAPDEMRAVFREELAPVEERLRGEMQSEIQGLRGEMREGFARVTKALLYLANSGPGTMPGQKSHTSREMEEDVTPAGRALAHNQKQSWAGRIEARRALPSRRSPS